MERIMGCKIKVVNKRLYAFDLRVLKRPRTTLDISTFLTEFSRLCSDVFSF